MSNRIPHCLGDYDFTEIADFAHQRFVEGVDTVTLLSRAQSDRERDQIVLVSLLNVEDDTIREIRLECRHADSCEITDCRRRLRKLLQDKLVARSRRR